MIIPLMPYWQLGKPAGTPVLPSFYTEYYSQEDRLKAMAKIIGRMQAWELLALEKINELTETVNELEARIEALEV